MAATSERSQAVEPPRRSDATRAAILASAREQFAAAGYQGATIRAIAAAAGIDPALVESAVDDEAMVGVVQGLRSNTKNLTQRRKGAREIVEQPPPAVLRWHRLERGPRQP